ncbi:MAG TPA: hypothetical protein VKD72_13800 [Gemmataceae bacterium]|nr:hypothetical protein [Gemmataceae bacterium]
MTRLPLLLLPALCVAFAPAPMPKDRGNRTERLEGIWVRVSDGRVVEIAPRRMTYDLGTNNASHYALTTDPAASPAAYDLADVRTGQVYYLGVYRLSGDDLTMCYNPAADGRPTGFDPASGALVEVFKRKKP